MPDRVPTHRPCGLPRSSADDYRRTEKRLADNRFYASTAWRKLRLAFLREHPTCADCESRGILTLATEVHHVKERRDYPELALDWDNLQALCRCCHNAKRKESKD